MKSKTSKFILKTLYYFPIGFLIGLFQDGFELSYIWVPLLYGFIIGLGIVFWQTFEYEKFSHISRTDFLESQH